MATELDSPIDSEVEVDWPDYRSTRLRHPSRPLVILPGRFADFAGPVVGDDVLGPNDDDLTRQHEGEPLGERIVVQGRVLDTRGRPVRDSLVEVWQANRAGPAAP